MSTKSITSMEPPTRRPDENLIHGIVERLTETRKYRAVCPDALARMAAWALARHPDPKEALKAAKRKLHQVSGAYLEPGVVKEAERVVDGMDEGTGRDDLRRACLTILGCHASTRERLGILDGVFPALFEDMPRPRVILDLACGLNPFALPWMSLTDGATYYAYDIDRRLIDLLNRFGERAGLPLKAACGDLLTSPPDVEADVVFLFKALPCLEQQEKGAGLALLRKVRARFAVVSFPAQSLGGRHKGMPEHYDTYMKGLLDELGTSSVKIAFPTEVFYAVALKA